MPPPAYLRGFVRILSDFYFLHSVTFRSQFSLSSPLFSGALTSTLDEVRIFQFIIIVNSIDYMRTYQRGLIGELVGGGE